MTTLLHPRTRIGRFSPRRHKPRLSTDWHLDNHSFQFQHTMTAISIHYPLRRRYDRDPSCWPRKARIEGKGGDMKGEEESSGGAVYLT